MAIRVDGRRLTIRLEAASAASARATLEDLLACIQLAERSAGILPGRSPSS